ncbi:MAG: hypothetical protein SGPRY_008206 [Prymnesium sp.]
MVAALGAAHNQSATAALSQLAEETASRQALESRASELEDRLERSRRKLASSRKEVEAATLRASELASQRDLALVRAEDSQMASERALRATGQSHAGRSVELLRGAGQMLGSALRRYEGAWVNRAHRSAVATAALRGGCELLAPLSAQLASCAPSLVSPQLRGGSRVVEAAGTAAAGWQGLREAVAAMPSDWRLASSCAERLVAACEVQGLLLDTLAVWEQPQPTGQEGEEIEGTGILEEPSEAAETQGEDSWQEGELHRLTLELGQLLAEARDSLA